MSIVSTTFFFGQGFELFRDPPYLVGEVEWTLPNAPPELPIDHVSTLLDLARQGDETTFKDLAACVGVPKDQLDEMWLGTVRRVQKGQ